jgi:hypothetical protein
LSLVLRPFVYLLIGLVWTAIAGIFVAVGPGVLVLVAVAGEGLGLGGMWARLMADPSQLVALFLLIPLLILLWGPGVLGYLSWQSWPLAVLSFLYVGRSLNPGYAGEKLSYTTWAGRGQSLGPPTLGGVALSLQPVRQTAVTGVLMRFYWSGWDPDGAMFLAMLPAGGAWLVGVVGFSYGIALPVRIVLLAVFAGLAGWSVVLGRRAWVRRFDPAPPWGSVRVVDLTPAERRKRMAELTRKRDRRASGR